jgi:hypothetical protein
MTKSVKKVSLDTIAVKLEGFDVRLHTDLPEGHPFYAVVGLIASEWAHVEHILDLIVWKLAGIDPKHGACITAQIMGISGRCKAIVALANLQRLPTELAKRVRTLMERSYDAADRRACIVHDPWFIEIGEDSIGQFKSMAYKDQRFGIIDVSETEVSDTLRRIRELKTIAGDLHRDFHDALEALRRNRP